MLRVVKMVLKDSISYSQSFNPNFLISSSVHLVYLVHVRSGLVSKKGYHYRKPYCCLRSCDSNYEEGKYLSPHVLKIMAERNEADIYTIKHQLDRHEHDDNIPS